MRAQHAFPGSALPGFPFAIPVLQPGFLPDEISDTKQ